MRHQLGISILLMAAFGPPAAMADLMDLTTYTINFTGNGLLPTAGSFTFDPDTPKFSNFLVTWDGTIFDLTSSANAPTIFGPPPCIGLATGAAATYILLSGGCPSSGTEGSGWTATFTTTGQIDFFTDDLLDPTNFVDVRGGSVTAGVDTARGGGNWAISSSATAVPEPSALILLLTTLLSVAFVARKRIARGCRQATGTGR